MRTIIDKQVRCPVCKTNEFIESFHEDGCYVCSDYIGNEYEHMHPVACYCKTCEKIYPIRKFEKTGDVYVCKECDRKQWGLTLFYRDWHYWVTNFKEKGHSKYINIQE